MDSNILYKIHIQRYRKLPPRKASTKLTPNSRHLNPTAPLAPRLTMNGVPYGGNPFGLRRVPSTAPSRNPASKPRNINTTSGRTNPGERYISCAAYAPSSILYRNPASAARIMNTTETPTYPPTTSAACLQAGRFSTERAACSR